MDEARGHCPYVKSREGEWGVDCPETEENYCKKCGWYPPEARRRKDISLVEDYITVNDDYGFPKRIKVKRKLV